MPLNTTVINFTPAVNIQVLQRCVCNLRWPITVAEQNVISLGRICISILYSTLPSISNHLRTTKKCIVPSLGGVDSNSLVPNDVDVKSINLCDVEIGQLSWKFYHFLRSRWWRVLPSASWNWIWSASAAMDTDMKPCPSYPNWRPSSSVPPWSPWNDFEPPPLVMKWTALHIVTKCQHNVNTNHIDFLNSCGSTDGLLELL